MKARNKTFAALLAAAALSTSLGVVTPSYAADDNFVVVPGDSASSKATTDEARTDVAEQPGSATDAPRDTMKTLVPGDESMMDNNESAVRQSVAGQTPQSGMATDADQETYVPGDGSTSNYK